MADALQRAGSIKADELQKALMATDIPVKDLLMPWEGIQFDPQTHQNTKAQAILVQIGSGKDSTVWPFEFAAKDVSGPLSSNKKRIRIIALTNIFFALLDPGDEAIIPVPTWLMASPGKLANLAKQRGLKLAYTIFADRAYNDGGSLVSRSIEGSAK